MKILCVCQRGNVRSASLAYILKDAFGHDAVAIGWQTAGPELQGMLFVWAERIVVMECYIAEKIPIKYREKTYVCDVGPDVYGDVKHPSLIGKVTGWAEKLKEQKPVCPY